MTPEQFCYWLQGRFELLPDVVPTETEWKMIAAHLQTVFHKVTPNRQTLLDTAQDHMRRARDQNQTVVSPSWGQPPIVTC